MTSQQPPLDSPEWLTWYTQLRNDRVRRQMGLNAPDVGVTDSVDRIELMNSRGEEPQPNPNFDSIREEMGLPPLKDKEVRRQMGLEQ